MSYVAYQSNEELICLAYSVSDPILASKKKKKKKNQNLFQNYIYHSFQRCPRQKSLWGILRMPEEQSRTIPRSLTGQGIAASTSSEGWNSAQLPQHLSHDRHRAAKLKQQGHGNTRAEDLETLCW